MRISDWSSDGCSSDLRRRRPQRQAEELVAAGVRLEGEGDVLADLQAAHVEYRAEALHHLMGAAAIDAVAGEDANQRVAAGDGHHPEIGRASCRERVCQYV